MRYKVCQNLFPNRIKTGRWPAEKQLKADAEAGKIDSLTLEDKSSKKKKSDKVSRLDYLDNEPQSLDERPTVIEVPKHLYDIFENSEEMEKIIEQKKNP